jgi:hypothetical protein
MVGRVDAERSCTGQGAALTFASGFCNKTGNKLCHLIAFAFRADRPLFVVLGYTLGQSKLAAAIITLVFIGRHKTTLLLFVF